MNGLENDAERNEKVLVEILAKIINLQYLLVSLKQFCDREISHDYSKFFSRNY